MEWVIWWITPNMLRLLYVRMSSYNRERNMWITGVSYVNTTTYGGAIVCVNAMKYSGIILCDCFVTVYPLERERSVRNHTLEAMQCLGCARTIQLLLIVSYQPLAPKVSHRPLIWAHATLWVLADDIWILIQMIHLCWIVVNKRESCN